MLFIKKCGCFRLLILFVLKHWLFNFLMLITPWRVHMRFSELVQTYLCTIAETGGRNMFLFILERYWAFPPVIRYDCNHGLHGLKRWPPTTGHNYWPPTIAPKYNWQNLPNQWPLNQESIKFLIIMEIILSYPTVMKATGKMGLWFNIKKIKLMTTGGHWKG